MSIIQVYQLMFSWLPAWLQVAVLGLIAFLMIIIVFKIVAFVLDAIPFL